MKFRKYFITGLITILPIWVTIFVIFFIFKLIGGLTKPFLKPFIDIFFEKQPAAFLLNITSFVLTIIVICMAGLLTTYIFSRNFMLGIEKNILRLPLVSDIYLPIKQLSKFFLSGEKKYSQVVLVEFPWKGIHNIGFITSEHTKITSGGEELVSVFIPKSPNPTTGFLAYLPKSSIKNLDISVEDALKTLISGGIINPEHNRGTEE